jgi:pyrroline-5-carboxylate reductase
MKKGKQKTIAFLGAGNMAEAIIKGVLDAALFKPENVIASDISKQRLAEVEKKYKIRTTAVNREAVEQGDLIILGVKPITVDPVLIEVGSLLTGKLLVSVAAGIPISRLSAHLSQNVAVIRAMPNAASRVLASATVLTCGPHVEKAALEECQGIFNSIGKTWILEERLLDAVTGLSGSGPAYVMVVIESLAEGGVKCGLDYDIAMALATQTVLGGSLWLSASGEHPARLKDVVTSPGGTTIAGLHQLEAGGVRSAFISAVEAATARSKELGQQRQ